MDLECQNYYYKFHKRLMWRASGTYYKLEIDKTNPMLLTGWYFNVN